MVLPSALVAAETNVGAVASLPKLNPPTTLTGFLRSAVVPSPTEPWPFRPQHWIAPVPKRTHVRYSPTDTAVAPLNKFVD